MTQSDAPAFDLASLTAALKARMDQFVPTLTVAEAGTVVQVGQGVARCTGLDQVPVQELVEFTRSGTLGLTFSLEPQDVGIIILGSTEDIRVGDTIRAIGRTLSVPAGAGLIGRVVDPLGRPIDGKGPINATVRPLERMTPSVIQRANIDTPLQTGIKAIDALVPIGRGQRQLVVGDRGTGKTTLCIDTLINQKDKNVVCVYVAIGQTLAQTARWVAKLEAHAAMRHTIVVAATAADSAALQYLAPYAGCAMGEEIMENGVTLDGQFINDALVVYDDLTQHTRAYQQISRGVGRPVTSDTTRLHGGLLERAARLAPDWVIREASASGHWNPSESVNGKLYGGAIGDITARRDMQALIRQTNRDYELVRNPRSGGSLTALPIVETQVGNLSAQQPTDMISITDGQLFLDADLFNVGIRPAINVGISVSRVGSAGQTRAMKQVAGRLKGELAQFRELQTFAALGSDLNPATLRQLERGQRLVEIFKQPPHAPQPLWAEVAVLFAAIHGLLDAVPVQRIGDWQAAFLAYFEVGASDLVRTMADEQWLSDDTTAKLKAKIEAFSRTFG